MMFHLPPSFACSKCDRKFVKSYDLSRHLQRHAGILNEVCKICNKGYSIKDSLRNHIIHQHFSKMHCEVDNCSYKTGWKPYYKKHLNGMHKNMIENILKNLEKMKPDFRKMKYVL